MSSSAFTPSTTTVTNNVPVNVPVVEASQLITATVTNGGTISGQKVNISRVGDKLFFEGSINFSAAGSAANFELNMPTGLTIDTSKLDSATGAYGNHIGTAGWWDNGVGSKQLMPWVDTSTRISFAIAGSAVNLKGNDLAIGDSITFALFLPIAEWSGSGTTTLATRAVEEYAWNSNTADGNDTTSFAYGPSGVVFGSYTANRQKTVRFQSAILPTDSLAIEILIPGSTIWQPIQTVNNFASIFVEAGATNYGMRFEPLNSTDVTIIFGAWRKPSSGTYAAAGAPWSDITTTRWRLRKVSSGAQVGYPVSARNIVGDTSGSVVPVGMIGQLVTASGTRIFSGVTGSAWYVGTLSSGSGITLTPGIWLVGYSLETGWTGGTNAVTTAILTTDTADGSPSNNTSASLTSTAAFLGNIEGFTQTSTVPVKKEASGYLNVTSNTTYTIKVNANVTTFTGSYTCRFYAIRIA